MPNRIIKESIKRSPEIDRLSWFEEIVFYRLIVTADDYGRLDGRVVVLKNDLFPTKDAITKKAIEDAISKLVSVGLLIPYVDAESNMPFLMIRKWEKHQTIRNKYSRYPAPPEDLTANCNQMFANCNQTSAKCCDESESESNPNTNTHPRFGAKCARFDDFWAVYPNKVKKKDAMTAWRTGKCDKVADRIIADVKLRRDTEWNGQEMHYVPHPTTYLHQRRWEDETPPQERREKTALDRNPGANPALNYDQREYSNDEFDESFFVDLSKYD